MSSPHASHLAIRNDLLEELWVADHEIRTTPKGNERARMLGARKRLADELRDMGCEPWPFSARMDNTWLMKRRGAP